MKRSRITRAIALSQTRQIRGEFQDGRYTFTILIASYGSVFDPILILTLAVLLKSLFEVDGTTGVVRILGDVLSNLSSSLK